MIERNETRTHYRVLTIAGSDSGGGAGIQADIKTFSALGCYGMSVITALTAQNTRGVTGIHPVPLPFVARQIAAVLTDIGADAVKIGMLHSAELVEVVASSLRAHNPRNIVLDPVMVAQSGDRLSGDDTIEALKKHLMPLADVLTPNIPEAEMLLDRELRSPEDLRQGARELAEYGSRSVLIKGGHSMEEDTSTDLLYLAAEDRFVTLTDQRVETRNNHGTGCTLSSAIAGFLAKGHNIQAAVEKAKSYIGQAIRAGAEYTLGQGGGPVHHFFEYW
uniref:hydroxymethylpyrimidine kinase n=1 Tax=Candidatus Kentrum eta TaxID=2126337 RepID=A0A450UFQ5_9GAMM|nr:MAG: hydroxymethylpyrimidine/phosphomethylpyrimidine kinase [Candidatus Kentron sp. H]VFJ91391.1 MAG: hydroxymethylpyrimidine/phosphomethylpyrimidine kinase [Candidatus Kentron sp. H]VFJ98050.1 MAG: hydroxymethylpyrimidine/phosphomethylpyrimidine kinase [Candidatus Kentron sp. H]